MITIKQIAEQLNLSTTTVSNVIHGKTREVSPDTIMRVQSFLNEVGYVPNISARNLAESRSRIIGLVLKTQNYTYEHVLSDPFVSKMISGIEQSVREAGYFLMLYISDDIAEIIRHVATWNVDGLLLFCMLDDDSSRVSAAYRKPIVCIDTYPGSHAKRFVNIGLNDEQAAFDATNYLIRSGHTRIGFLADNQVGVDLVRFRGYRRALREAGIEYSDHYFLRLPQDGTDLHRNMSKLCKQTETLTAVFCCSDLYAASLIAELYDRGIRVPEDLSVIGFDDNNFAQLMRPALTTMHQDAHYKGQLATETLISLIQGKEDVPDEILLKAHLVVRDTVRKI